MPDDIMRHSLFGGPPQPNRQSKREAQARNSLEAEARILDAEMGGAFFAGVRAAHYLGTACRIVAGEAEGLPPAIQGRMWRHIEMADDQAYLLQQQWCTGGFFG